jgi:pyrimidine operon attenuation protein/uracil phosphoribosyltransferase
MSQSIILSNQQINHKIKRIAFEIYENNINESSIILAGISKNGFIFAQKLKNILENISDINVRLCEVIINKRQPLENITTSLKTEEYKDQSLVLVDDVLSSGTTLMYAVKHFLQVPLKQFKTAVLVNRNHKKYPIKADFKGISLSTSLQEHIKVVFNNNSANAYLE